MRTNAQAIASTLAVLALAGLAGCASTTLWGGKSASREVKTHEFVPPPAEPAKADAQSVRQLGAGDPVWGGPPERPETQTEITPARAILPVGIFGEQIGGRPSTPRPQGQGNLAQISFLTEGASFDPAIDSTSRRIAFASTMHQSGSNLYIKTIGGSTVTQLTSDPADDVMPCFSPGGDRIAFASNRAGKWDIYVISVNGGPAIQFTNDADHEIHPTWSPDGRNIAYCKFNSQSGRWEVWVAEVENPGVRRFLDYGMFPRWSPDVASSKILFQRPRQRGSRLHGIWTVDYVNGQAMHPTEIVSAANAAAINPSWSPDGQRIAFVTVVDPETAPSDRPERSDLWVVNLDGSGRVRLTDGQFANFQPVWSGSAGSGPAASGGGSIYFISNRSGTDNIWAIATDRILDMNTTGATDVVGAPTDRE